MREIGHLHLNVLESEIKDRCGDLLLIHGVRSGIDNKRSARTVSVVNRRHILLKSNLRAHFREDGLVVGVKLPKLQFIGCLELVNDVDWFHSKRGYLIATGLQV